MAGEPTHLRDAPCCAIDRTAPVEDYLKTVFTITSAGSAATTSAIADHLGVTPSSASIMVSRLRRAGLVEQVARGQVRLSSHGMGHARRVVRRHRLLETFLHRVLGMPWDQLHQEAEILEHHLSARVESLIDAALGFPERDPHGDPIPSLQGGHEEHCESPLAGRGPGDFFLVQRVYDTDSTALRQLARLDIRPGAVIEVVGRPSGQGPMAVRVGGRVCSLSQAVVDLIHGQVQASKEAS